jgi:large subunit ribosomal protein L33
LPSGKVGAQWAPASSPRFSNSRGPMAKKAVRVVINLACTECKERNYTTEKNRRNDSARMELKKYCPRCRTHRLHRETK